MKKLILSLLLLGLMAGSASAYPTWTGTSLLAYATDNNTSATVTLPRDCKGEISMILPTIESSTVAVHVSYDGTTFYALHYNAGAAAAPAAWLVGAGSGALAIEIPSAALNYPYLRFEFGTGQTANRTMRVLCR